MQFRLILNALLFFAAWMNLVQATGGPGNDCPCVSVSSKNIPHTKIKEYTIQKERVCVFSLVVFRTVSGRIFCADPNSKWAKSVIQKLEAKTTIQHISQQQNVQTSRTTPLASTKLWRTIATAHKPEKDRK